MNPAALELGLAGVAVQPGTGLYLPPPAQAQAQPAQAQAQAQPPPPLERWLPLLVETGTGLVLLVTLLVKSDRFPITFPEKFCTPLTMEAAKSEPGRWGKEILPPPGPAVDIGAEAGPR